MFSILQLGTDLRTGADLPCGDHKCICVLFSISQYGMHLCITQHCPSRHRGPAPTLLRYSNTTDGMLIGLHNSAVCVSFPREREFYSHCGFIPQSSNFFFVSLGLLSLKVTLVLIPSCKHVTDVQDRNRMVQQVFEKDRGRFALSKCNFFGKKKEYCRKGDGKTSFRLSKSLSLEQRVAIASVVVPQILSLRHPH